MFENVTFETIAGTIGEIEQVWAKLTDYSFEYYFYYQEKFLELKLMRIYYTDKTERLTSELWQKFLELNDIPRELKDKLTETDSPLEQYEILNCELAPLVNLLLNEQKNMEDTLDE
ncbi:MAG: hypothetical protein FWE82_10325 [Defluviitaleaceae bacterium]|nr:hypothetical protein [Defluviitaleaceae bacterium]